MGRKTRNERVETINEYEGHSQALLFDDTNEGQEIFPSLFRYINNGEW